MGTTEESGLARGRPRRLDPFVALRSGGDLVAVGGELSTERLLEAYSSGVFPWYEDDSPVLWWCPDPRAVLELDALRIPRRLERTYRSGRFRITRDRAFDEVIRQCAWARPEGTWITDDMINAYCRLHELGHAHSVESWRKDRLVGGIYGVTIGGLFAGESMFHRESDASKVALLALVEHLRERGFELFDVQVLNDHTERLGAIEISRDEYFRRLRRAVRSPVSF